MSGNNCVVVLVDESSAMSVVMRDKLADGSESTKTNAARVATSVNNLLKHLADGPLCDVAVVGYRSDAEGKADVGCRWPAGLAGLEFVPSTDLPAAARRETRVRRVPQSDGSLQEEPVDFSVWYEPVLGAKGPQIAAFRYCRELIERWRGGHQQGQPMIVHVFSGSSGDGSPQMAVDELLKSGDAGSKPIIVQCHMAASSALPTSAFPSKQAYLATGSARDLFARASELSPSMLKYLQTAKLRAQGVSRAMIHNAKIADLFHCLQLARQHVAGNAAATAPLPLPTATAATVALPASPASSFETTGPFEIPAPVAEAPAATTPAGNVELVTLPSTSGYSDLLSFPSDTDLVSPPTTHAGVESGQDRAALAVLILDRSVDDPFSGHLDNPCSKLQAAANEILKQLSTRQFLDLPIDAAIISYGQGQDGSPDVRGTFDGPLAGRACVRNSELAGNAIRVEEEERQVSNGAGGLVTVNQKRPIYFDVEPAAGTSPQAAFELAATIISDWAAQNPSGLPPILLHFTRAAHDPTEMVAAVAVVTSLKTAAGPVLIHHLVFTESPHKSLSYPDSSADIEGAGLKALWEASSPLPAWERLKEAKRPYLTAASRGFVVNGKFDTFADELANATAPA